MRRKRPYTEPDRIKERIQAVVRKKNLKFLAEIMYAPIPSPAKPEPLTLMIKGKEIKVS